MDDRFFPCSQQEISLSRLFATSWLGMTLKWLCRLGTDISSMSSYDLH
jgi:hypothetical protein